MLGCQQKILPLLLVTENMDAHSLNVGRNLYTSDGILAPPALFDSVVEENAQSMQVMPHRNIADIVRVESPGLVCSILPSSIILTGSD